jgi:hypothetical protein
MSKNYPNIEKRWEKQEKPGDYLEELEEEQHEE